MALVPDTQERAYQLARDGEVHDVKTLRRRLRGEGYDPDRLPTSALPGLEVMFERASDGRR